MADCSDFQLKEYENISQAHFKTNEMIAAFFRYYLLIMAIPVTSIGTAFLSASKSDVDLQHFLDWHFAISVFLVSWVIL